MKTRFPRSLRKQALALASALAMAACAPLPPLAQAPTLIRSTHAAFEIDTRLSATDGERAVSGQIEWQHAPAFDRWTAYSPLGQIVARLDSTPAGAELLLADGKRHHAESAASLLPALLGVDLPLTRLPQWIQASPPSDAEVREVDSHGRPQLLIDQGWRIDYTDYLDTTAAALPRRMEISRGDARVRLVIDRWTLQP